MLLNPKLQLRAVFMQVFDLQYASPATISRCGMVFVDPKDLGYKPYWDKWVSLRVNKMEQDFLPRLYNKYVPSIVDMIIEGILDGKQGEKLPTIVPLTNLNLVRIMCTTCLYL